MLRRVAAGRTSSLLQRICQNQYGCGAVAASGTTAPSSCSPNPSAIWFGSPAAAAYSQAAFNTAAWTACNPHVAGNLPTGRSRSALCDPAHSANALLSTARHTAADVTSAASGCHIANSGLVRLLSSLPGPPPSVPSGPTHTSGGKDTQARSERHTAAEQLSEQLEDLHGPPAAPADDVDLGSAGIHSARSVAEAAALLQVPTQMYRLHTAAAAAPDRKQCGRGAVQSYCACCLEV